MDFEDSPAEAAARTEVRAFLDQHAELKRGDDRDWSRWGATTDDARATEYRRRCRGWQATLYDNGWAGITWPEEWGGRGGTRTEQIIFGQEAARYDVTSGFIGAAQSLVGPTLIKWGTDEQKERYVRPLLRGDEVWCQLFSEPGAGSDLSNLAARAVPAYDPADGWVVDGQKVWTSSAQHADFGILLARTDPDAPKHRGISFFIVDMATPGIDIRPLIQAQGVAHFNEVFLDAVRVPAKGLVGEVGNGWKVARTTLGNESQMISGGGQANTFPNVLATARRLGRTDDPVVRQELARVWGNEAILKYLQLRLQSAITHERWGDMLHGSLLKNAFTRALAHRTTLAVDLEGAEGMLWDDAEGNGFWQYQCLNQFAARIGGGTEEVHRNNLSEQALGLPREQRSDLDVPWSQTTRS